MGDGGYDDAIRRFDEALRIFGRSKEVRNELRSARLEAVNKKHQNPRLYFRPTSPYSDVCFFLIFS